MPLIPKRRDKVHRFCLSLKRMRGLGAGCGLSGLFLALIIWLLQQILLRLA